MRKTFNEVMRIVSRVGLTCSHISWTALILRLNGQARTVAAVQTVLQPRSGKTETRQRPALRLNDDGL